MNTPDGIGKVLESKERPYYMGVTDHFGPIQTNIPHTTPN